MLCTFNHFICIFDKSSVVMSDLRLLFLSASEELQKEAEEQGKCIVQYLKWTDKLEIVIEQETEIWLTKKQLSVEEDAINDYIPRFHKLMPLTAEWMLVVVLQRKELNHN